MVDYPGIFLDGRGADGEELPLLIHGDSDIKAGDRVVVMFLQNADLDYAGAKPIPIGAFDFFGPDRRVVVIPLESDLGAPISHIAFENVLFTPVLVVSIIGLTTQIYVMESIYVEDGSTSDPEIIGRTWTFGDSHAGPSNPNTSSDKNASHRYEETGVYDISLKVWNEFLSDTVTIPNYVTVKIPTPRTLKVTKINDYTFKYEWEMHDVHDICHISFKEAGGIGPYYPSYIIDEGTVVFDGTKLHEGGNSPTGGKIVKYYGPDPPKYVYLSMWGRYHGAWSDPDECRTLRVTIPSFSAEISPFTIPDQTINLGEYAYWNIPVEGNPAVTSWKWDFGDDSAILTKSNSLANHLYESAGMYDVTLTVGNGEATRVVYSAGAVVVETPRMDFAATSSKDGSYYKITYDWWFDDKIYDRIIISYDKSGYLSYPNTSGEFGASGVVEDTTDQPSEGATYNIMWGSDPGTVYLQMWGRPKGKTNFIESPGLRQQLSW